jgi:uncharacterized protein (UPF0248 family)
MQPIHELLNRIRWDKDFAQGEFEIEFIDHKQNSLQRLTMRSIGFMQGDHFFFYYLDEEGEEHAVPLHRIRSVYKDGERIWHRPE